MTRAEPSATRVAQRWLAALALAAYALVALVPFERLVLCVRSDGHVGLEVAREDGCLDCGREAPSAADGCCSRSNPGEEQAPCDDIPVLEHAEEPSTRATAFELPEVVLGFVGLAWVAPAELAPEAGDARRPAAPPRAPPFQLALVLRV